MHTASCITRRQITLFVNIVCVRRLERVDYSNVVISAIDSKWCDNHFVCMGCFVSLSSDNVKFVDWDNKPFCKDCFGTLGGETRRKVLKYRELEKKLQL
jgi:hypothetical protein